MALTDMMSDDLDRLTEDGSDLGVDATYRAAEATSGYPIRVVFGDPADALQGGADGTADNMTATCTTRLSTLQEEIGRRPQPGDRLTIEAGEMQGEWEVVGVIPDIGDGVNLSLRNEQYFSAGRTVRG